MRVFVLFIDELLGYLFSLVYCYFLYIYKLKVSDLFTHSITFYSHEAAKNKNESSIKNTKQL